MNNELNKNIERVKRVPESFGDLERGRKDKLRVV